MTGAATETQEAVRMFDDERREFRVVLNDEEQYSIWPTDREVPAGWRPDGFVGVKAACLAHIDRTWTDLRPASLRHADAARG